MESTTRSAPAVRFSIEARIRRPTRRKVAAALDGDRLVVGVVEIGGGVRQQRDTPVGQQFPVEFSEAERPRFMWRGLGSPGSLAGWPCGRRGHDLLESGQRIPDHIVFTRVVTGA